MLVYRALSNHNYTNLTAVSNRARASVHLSFDRVFFFIPDCNNNKITRRGPFNCWSTYESWCTVTIETGHAIAGRSFSAHHCKLYVHRYGMWWEMGGGGCSSHTGTATGQHLSPDLHLNECEEVLSRKYSYCDAIPVAFSEHHSISKR
jgi:hypothetical protein